MTTIRKNIRILVGGQPEKNILDNKIVKDLKDYFPNIDFEVNRLGIKSTLLSDYHLSRHYLLLKNNPNLVCIFLPDFHPNNCLSLDHTNIKSLRNDIYNIIERIHPTIKIPNYKERFLIHTLKQGGEVLFLANLDIVFRELGINNEIFINKIKNRCNLDNLEDSEQRPEEVSYEKLILKDIFHRAGKSYNLKNYQNIINKLKLKNLINHLPHFKLFLIDLFKFSVPNNRTLSFMQKYDLE